MKTQHIEHYRMQQKHLKTGVYCDKCPNEEKRKISNKQPTFIPQVTRKKRKKVSSKLSEGMK
jgi:hypothetical protein